MNKLINDDSLQSQKTDNFYHDKILNQLNNDSISQQLITKEYMRNNDQQTYRYSAKHQIKYKDSAKQTDSDWNFQKVNSVYQLAKDPTKNRYDHQQHLQQQVYKNLTQQKDYYYQQKYPTFHKTNLYQAYQQSNQITAQNPKIPKNPSSKSNSQTNIISQSQSLQYLSSQEPSFTNNGEFTVCEDFNIDLISPVKTQRPVHFETNVRKDWQLASFSSKYHRKDHSLYQKCMRVYEFVQQLKFMKEGFQSKLKQQKVSFSNQIQQLKKLLFRLNIKYEKQMLEFTQKQPRPISRQSSMRQSAITNDSGLQTELIQLKNYCKRMQQEKARSEQKYQSTLKKYQQQIQLISEQFEKKLALQRSSHLPKFSSRQQQYQCMNCINNHQKKGIETYEVEIWKNRLREQQQNHSQAMRRLEQKVLMLHDEFQILQKSKTQTQKALKQKQKQVVYRQAEIQYKLKDIDRRQRDLTMAESMIQKQRQQIQRKKDKITDYELKVLKQQRKQKNQVKEKEFMTSEYFNNCEKKRILTKGNPDRSDSVSSKGSRIDINARLKEIQMMRNRPSRNYDQNASSRNSSKDSRTSGYKDHATSRVTLTSRNLPDYGITPSSSVTPKQFSRGNTQTIKLSQKLNKLTETLQKQLRQMD